MTITWEQLLAFLCEEQTMAITSLLFLAFFAAVALVNYALPRVARPYFLLVASYGQFFYFDRQLKQATTLPLSSTASISSTACAMVSIWP